MEILKQFLSMPISGTDKIFEKFLEIRGAEIRGEGLDRFLFIKGKRENRVVLVAHADTVWDSRYGCNPIEQELEEANGEIRNTYGGLGADDRAGIALIWLLKDLGHSILITDGEERGRLGAKYLMENHKDIADEINNNHQFAVEFDLRGNHFFKCYEVGTSDFRKYIKDNTDSEDLGRSSYTDIVTICKSICGVNFSIGYYNAHGYDECLKIDDWISTLDMSEKFLSQEYLPRFTRDS